MLIGVIRIPFHVLDSRGGEPLPLFHPNGHDETSVVQPLKGIGVGGEWGEEISPPYEIHFIFLYVKGSVIENPYLHILHTNDSFLPNNDKAWKKR